MPPAVSVIIPVYNVAAYLRRAVDSILSQTFTDFELFLVDDGSTDASGAICDTYQEKDKRVTVLHQPNGGAPAARNRGMDLASGRYFYFMDGDDWAEPHMLECLVEAAKRNAAQLVVAGFAIDTVERNGGLFRQVMEAGARFYGNQKAFRQDAARLFDCNLLYPPWNKLYSASYISRWQLRFPNVLWDDFPFNLAVIRNIERVDLIPAAGYHFMRERKDSETARYQPQMYEKREEEHSWLLELFSYWDVTDFSSREILARRYVERMVGCIENLTSPDSPVNGRERRRQVANMLENPRLQECLILARPRSLRMRLMLLPLKWRRPALCVGMGRLISFVKKQNHGLFARLKAGR